MNKYRQRESETLEGERKKDASFISSQVVIYSTQCLHNNRENKFEWKPHILTHTAPVIEVQNSIHFRSEDITP